MVGVLFRKEKFPKQSKASIEHEEHALDEEENGMNDPELRGVRFSDDFEEGSGFADVTL